MVSAESLALPCLAEEAAMKSIRTTVYGIGVTRPVPQSNPQTLVRAYEVETVTPAGQHRYVVAIDIDAGHHV